MNKYPETEACHCGASGITYSWVNSLGAATQVNMGFGYEAHSAFLLMSKQSDVDKPFTLTPKWQSLKPFITGFGSGKSFRGFQESIFTGKRPIFFFFLVFLSLFFFFSKQAPLMYAQLCLLGRFKRPFSTARLRLKVDFFFFGPGSPNLFLAHKRHEHSKLLESVSD